MRESDDDQVTLIGAGVTLHEAIKAADALAADGINARVIDLYSVKPIDVDTLAAASQATGGRLVVVEDHWPEGGIGEAVISAFADTDERPRVVKLAVDAPAGLGQGGRAAARLRDRRRRDRRRRAPAGGARTADRQHRRRGHSLALARSQGGAGRGISANPRAFGSTRSRPCRLLGGLIFDGPASVGSWAR